MLALMLLVALSLLHQGFAKSVANVPNVSELYRQTVIHFKAPDVEAGKTRKLTPQAEKLLHDAKHFENFKKEFIDVQRHNTETNRQWKATTNNRYMLETDDEFNKHLGLNITDEAKEEFKEFDRQRLLKRSDPIDPAHIEVLENQAEEQSTDYSDFLPPVKHQGGCGSCWTFSAMAALEYQVNRGRTPGVDEMKALSEEQCMDCVDNRGCGGGWPTSCYKLGHFHFNRWASAYDYVYEGHNARPCRYKYHKDAMAGFKFSTNGATYIDSGEQNVLMAVSNPEIGVLSTGIHVASEMKSYESGVFSTNSCGGSATHAVAIVGYGVQNGVPYWRVRNSWGRDWGENGHINIRRGVNGEDLNMCRINERAHYPRLTGSEDSYLTGTQVGASQPNCGDGQQIEYRGTISTTASGKTCQNWSLQEPHTHSYTPENEHYSGIGEHNLCRNPDDGTKAWCYTTDPDTRWEHCDVPSCEQQNWCAEQDKGFGEREFDTRTEANTACYPDDNCEGITENSEGKFVVAAPGPKIEEVGRTVYVKGRCKEFEPVVANFCRQDEQESTGHDLAEASTLDEALEMCTSSPLCELVTGGETGRTYRLKNSRAGTRQSDGSSIWFKGGCPDLSVCGYGDQADYRGDISITKSGVTCQAWEEQTPTTHDRTPENYPGFGLENNNHCRNPDGEDSAWCYTISAGERWDYCDIPTC